MGSVVDHLKFKLSEEDNCRLASLQVHFTSELTHSSLATELAYALAKIRFGSQSDHFKYWDETVRRLRTNSGLEKKILTAYVRPSLGTKTNPLASDQIEGVVAETLWYEVVSNFESQEGLPIRMEEPHFTVTEPGGDGLAIYKDSDGKYLFRLWEVKKHNTSSTATSKITEASQQLSTKGVEYLAKWSKVSQEVDSEHADLSKFYAKLVEMWLVADPQARAGISVSKNLESYITNTPVATAKAQLTNMIHDGQVEVMLIDIPDFTSLAEDVRKVIWSGI